MNAPNLTSRSHVRIKCSENSPGLIPYALHPPTPSATPVEIDEYNIYVDALCGTQAENTEIK